MDVVCKIIRKEGVSIDKSNFFLEMKIILHLHPVPVDKTTLSAVSSSHCYKIARIVRACHVLFDYLKTQLFTPSC